MDKSYSVLTARLQADYGPVVETANKMYTAGILVFFGAAWIVPLVISSVSLAQLDAEVGEAVRECGHKAGLAVAIISRDETLGSFTYAQGFGLRDVERSLSADEDTLLCIGSVTKHFTATLLLHLLDLLNSTGQSKYSLQTLITDLDPTLAFQGSELIGATLEDILSMRTGLIDYFGPLMMGYPAHYRHRELARVSAQLPRFAPLRERYMYNNHVYALAGYACEILGSIYHNRSFTWEELTKIHLFDPVGMNQDANFAFADSGYLERVALPYTTVGGKHHVLPHQATETARTDASTGSICISAKGMAVWMELLVNKGTYQGKVIVQPKVFEETWKGRIATGDPGQEYALGWRESIEHGNKIVQHGGSVATYFSNLIVLPERKYAFFVSSAGGYSNHVDGLFRKLIDVFARTVNITAPADEYGNVSCESPILPPYAPTEPPVAIEKSLYVGNYSHPVYGSLEVSQEGDELALRIGEVGHAVVRCYHGGSCDLAFQGPLFYTAGSDDSSEATVDFGRTSSGFVVNVTIPMYSPPPKPPVVFTRSAPTEEKNLSSNGRFMEFFAVECMIVWVAVVLFWR